MRKTLIKTMSINNDLDRELRIVEIILLQNLPILIKHYKLYIGNFPYTY